MMSQHCSNKLPSREDVTGVIVKGGTMAKITNGDKFSNWAWWVAVSPFCKSTVFTRLGFHISVWLYIALANIAYFLVFFGGTKGAANDQEKRRSTDGMEEVDSFALRLLTWLLAGYIGVVVTAYYINVRSKASEMIQGLVHFVDGISISVDYDSPRAKAFLNDLYGALRATAHYALGRAAANTKFKLQKEELQAIFDDNGYDGKYLLLHQKKFAITLMRRAILRSLEEEREAIGSCFKKFYRNNVLKEENVVTALQRFANGAMRTMSNSSSKLPFAYVHLLTWATRTFLLFHMVVSYVGYALEHLAVKAKTPFSCYDSSLLLDGVDKHCVTEYFIFYNALNLLVVYFLMGILEIYPTLMKTWESQLVLNNYKLVIDLICEPLKADTYGQPKNLSQLKKEERTFGKVDEEKKAVARRYRKLMTSSRPSIDRTVGTLRLDFE